MNKKGDIFDILVFVIVLLVLAIGFFVISYTIPNITDGFNTAGLNNSAEGINAINQLENFGTIQLQRGFFFIFIGLILGIMVSAFFIRTHPIFLFLYIILMPLTVILAGYLGNFYETLTSYPIFADRLADQTLINIVMTNLIPISIGVGALSMIIIFSKFRIFGGAEPV